MIVGCALAIWVGCVVQAETLTIATYNVENYVAADRMTESGFRRDYPKPEVQKRALREVIAGLGADVLVLQEIGGEAYLEELRRDLAAAGVEYPHRAWLEAEDTERHVAVLSKRAFSEMVRHTALAFPYLGAEARVKRGLLEVHLATDAGDVAIFAVHLKSRYTDRPDDPRSELRRIGEATAVRDEILRRYPEPAAARFVIAGDFNDDKASKAVGRMLRRGDLVISGMLPAEDSRGDSWTHRFRRADTYTRVDHVLVSPGLRACVRGGKAAIYDGAGCSEASDHRPVVVTLALPDAQK